MKIICNWTVVSCVLFGYLIHFSNEVSLRPADCDDGYFLSTREDPDACMPCGACLDGAICDKVHQTCPNDVCEIWFVPPAFCNHYLSPHENFTSLSHLTNGPNARAVDGYKIDLEFQQNPDLMSSEWARYYVYRIQYAKPDGDFVDDLDYIQVQLEDTISVTIIGLIPNTEYRFRVVLYRVFENRIFEAITYSSVSYGSTQCAVPAIPEIVSAVPLADLNRAKVTWKELGAHHCHHYLSFQLHLQHMHSANISLQHFLPVESSHNTIVYDLVPGMVYFVRLQAENDAGLLSESLVKELNMVTGAIENNNTETRKGVRDNDNTGSQTVIIYTSISIGLFASIVGLTALVISVVLCRASRKYTVSPGKKDFENAVPKEGLAVSQHIPTLPPLRNEDPYADVVDVPYQQTPGTGQIISSQYLTTNDRNPYVDLIRD